MHYLKCIVMLDFLLKKLYAGQRQQVPVSVVSEVQTGVIAIQKMLEKENSPELKQRLNDIMESVIVIKSTQGLQFLTDLMKSTLTSGLTELSDDISLKAYQYFSVNDFEVSEEIIPVMRNVVKVALAKGVI